MNHVKIYGRIYIPNLQIVVDLSLIKTTYLNKLLRAYNLITKRITRSLYMMLEKNK